MKDFEAKQQELHEQENELGNMRLVMDKMGEVFGVVGVGAVEFVGKRFKQLEG
jgi:3-deoxy-D-manno-octulosonic-acid transferase